MNAVNLTITATRATSSQHDGLFIPEGKGKAKSKDKGKDEDEGKSKSGRGLYALTRR